MVDTSAAIVGSDVVCVSGEEETLDLRCTARYIQRNSLFV
jgi:hypothetical protein